MEIMFYIKTDDELFRVDCETLIDKGLYTDDNVAQAYLKNLVMYSYLVDE